MANIKKRIAVPCPCCGLRKENETPGIIELVDEDLPDYENVAGGGTTARLNRYECGLGQEQCSVLDNYRNMQWHLRRNKHTPIFATS